MKQKRIILLTIFAALTGIILSLLGNAFITALFSTTPPPAFIAPYTPFLGLAVGIVAFLSILFSVLLIPAQNVSTIPLTNSTSVQPENNTPLLPITFPCPVCNSNTLKVHGRSGNDLILICEHCWKTIRVTYKGSTLERLIIPGVITLVGASIIIDYLHVDPTDLFDLFTGLFF